MPLRRAHGWSILLGWLLLLPAAHADARAPTMLGPAQDTLELTPTIDYLHDQGTRTDDATAKAMFARAARGEFMPLPKEGPTFGFQSDTYWFHDSIINHNQDERRWLLVQRYALSDHVDLYLRYPDGHIIHQASGDQLPFSSRAVRYRQPNFLLTLPPGERVDMLVRVKSQSSMQVPLTLYTPTAFAQLERDAQFGIGIYYGILLALLVYNLVLWLWLRDATYFWYLFHVGGFGLVLFCLNGLAFEYLWPNSPRLQDWCIPVSICLAQMAMQQFARHFLELRQRSPVANRISLALISFFVLLGVASLLLPYRTTTPIASAAVFPSVIFIAWMAIMAMRRGFAPARLFGLAWALFLVGTAAFAAVAFGLLPKTFYTEYGVQLGSALEMLLLSVALGYRFASLRNENERIVRDTNAELERSVIARTAELRTTMAKLGEANTQLREYSQRDPLTGMYNRRHFRDAFERHLADALARGQSVALLIADLDNFKLINDTHGHVVGDDCLRWAASTFDNLLTAQGGTTARFGGEEFVAVLPGYGAQQALQAAEAVRETILAGCVQCGQENVRLTVSIGVHATVPERVLTPEEVLRAADEALYRAKHDGRNCVRQSAEAT